MIDPRDITPDSCDITSLWRSVTGIPVARATAHLRSGSVKTVRVQDEGTLIMCRNGASAALSPQAVAAIEARHSGRMH